MGGPTCQRHGSMACRHGNLLWRDAMPLAEDTVLYKARDAMIYNDKL